MSIKTFETREALKQKLRDRSLCFNNTKLDNVLASYNYFNLFNGLETIFLESSSPKSYHKTNLRDFMNLYQFDKDICSILSNCLNEVEERLKASIAYHFCELHCTSLQDTMQYTNKLYYMNPSNNTPGTPTYCSYSNTYPFREQQNKSIYDKFDDFCLFRSNFLTRLINTHDHIELSFYEDSAYSAPAGVAVYADAQNHRHTHVAVPFWVAIETLTFGEILRLLHYLQDNVMENVLNDFNLPLSKRFAFLNMLDFLLCLRNNCAHTTLINRFRTAKKYKINGLLISSFSLAPKHADSVLKLYDVIKILSFFTAVNTLKKPLRILKFKLYLSMGIMKGHKTYTKILDRMGCNNYYDWLKILSNTKYYL